MKLFEFRPKFPDLKTVFFCLSCQTQFNFTISTKYNDYRLFCNLNTLQMVSFRWKKFKSKIELNDHSTTRIKKSMQLVCSVVFSFNNINTTWNIVINHFNWRVIYVLFGGLGDVLVLAVSRAEGFWINNIFSALYVQDYSFIIDNTFFSSSY